MTATLKLYEYGNALDELRAQLFDAEGELTPELEAALTEAEGSFNEKAERVALFIRELQSNAKAVKEEAQRLSSRAAQYEKTADGLKHYLQREMERVEVLRVEGKLINVRLQKSPPSVVTTLADEEIRLLPAHYVTRVPELWKINKEAAIAAYKEGEPLPFGVEIVQNFHVRIG